MSNTTYILSNYQRADLFMALSSLAGADNYSDEQEPFVKAAQRALQNLQSQDQSNSEQKAF